MKFFSAIFSSGLIIKFEARDQIHAEVRAHHTAVSLAEHLVNVIAIQPEAA